MRNDFATCLSYFSHLSVRRISCALVGEPNARLKWEPTARIVRRKQRPFVWHSSSPYADKCIGAACNALSGPRGS